MAKKFVIEPWSSLAQYFNLPEEFRNHLEPFYQDDDKQFINVSSEFELTDNEVLRIEGLVQKYEHHTIEIHKKVKSAPATWEFDVTWLERNHAILYSAVKYVKEN